MGVGRKSVSQISMVTGETLKVHKSIRFAALDVVSSRGGNMMTIRAVILRCCNDCQMTAYGFLWKFTLE